MTNQTTLIYIRIVFWAIALLLPVHAFSLSKEDEKEYKDLYRTYVSLINSGETYEVHKHAEKYLNFLKDRNLYVQYFKIMTNVGFYDVSHREVEHAFMISSKLSEEMHAHGDSSLFYLSTGLKGDVFKMINDFSDADRIYRKALNEVGDRDPKFAMHVHMGLAQVHCLSNREEALKWSDMAIEEARHLDNYEFLSMGFGLKCYLYFMMSNADEFFKYESMLDDLRQQFENKYSKGSIDKRQTMSHNYDAIVNIAHHAFRGDFETAYELAENDKSLTDRHLIHYCLYGMEGAYKQEQIAKNLKYWLIGLTLVYIFIYIMGRRRLMLKIWKGTDELKKAKKRAEEASKMKSAFIRSMSHEIRTPLNAINGFSQVLCSPDFELSDEEKNDLREKISTNTDAITSIINELLELANGESSSLDSDSFKSVSVNRICNSVLEEAKKDNSKGLSLTFVSELTDDFTIKSDGDTVAQILSNIIDNAMKFTNKGGVELSAKAVGRNVEISVTDTGIGIPENQRDTIFDNFVKLDDFTEGVGLGLSICRRLANNLGGNIILDSKYRNGSRFIVQLPINES